MVPNEFDMNVAFACAALSAMWRLESREQLHEVGSVRHGLKGMHNGRDHTPGICEAPESCRHFSHAGMPKEAGRCSGIRKRAARRKLEWSSANPSPLFLGLEVNKSSLRLQSSVFHLTRVGSFRVLSPLSPRRRRFMIRCIHVAAYRLSEYDFLIR